MRTVGNLAQNKFSRRLFKKDNDVCFADFCGQLRERYFFKYKIFHELSARLLRSWVRIPPGAWIFVCCECRVLSGRGLCDELITRPEESYRLYCGVVCDLETSRMGAPYIYDISHLRVKHRVKSHLLFAGIIRTLPYSPR